MATETKWRDYGYEFCAHCLGVTLYGRMIHAVDCDAEEWEERRAHATALYSEINQ